MTGTIRVSGDLVSVKWDKSWVEDEISDDGPVSPADVEIMTATPKVRPDRAVRRHQTAG